MPRLNEDDDDLHRMKMAQAFHGEALMNTELNESSISDLVGAISDSLRSGNHESSGLIAQRSFQRAFTTGDLRRDETGSQNSSYLSYNNIAYQDESSLSESDSETDDPDDARGVRRIPAPEQSDDPPLFGNPARQGGAVLLDDPPEDNPDIVAKRAAMMAFDEKLCDEVLRNSQRFLNIEDDGSVSTGSENQYHFTTKKAPKRKLSRHHDGNSNTGGDHASSDLTTAPTKLQEATSGASIMRKGAAVVPGARLPGAYSMHGARVQGRRANGLVTPMSASSNLPLLEVPTEEEKNNDDDPLAPIEDYEEELGASADYHYDFVAECEYSSDDGLSHSSRNHSDDTGGISVLRRWVAGNASTNRSSASDSTDGLSVDASLVDAPDAMSAGQSSMGHSTSTHSRGVYRSTSRNDDLRPFMGNRSIRFLFPSKDESNRPHWRLFYCILVLVAIGGGIGVAIMVTGRKEPTPSTQAPSSTPGLYNGNHLNLFHLEILQKICPQGAKTFDASILPEDVVEAYAGYASSLDIDDPIDSCTANTLALLFVSASEVHEPVSIVSMYLLCVIYFSTGGPNAWNERGGWLESSEFCEWKGVNCLGSHILALNLANSGLTGTIPTTLRHFSDLEELRLDGNEFTGSLPSELGELPNLIILDLARNQVSGTLPPELSGNTNLRRLDFSLNRIAGTIPSEWVKMTSLMFLNGGSNFIESSIPTFLGDLRFLENIELQSNSISGSIPMELLNLTKLLEMDLSNNQITGTLPSEIDQFTQIEKFRSAFNRHTGTIPSQIGRLSGLAELAVQGNELTGTIPSELGLCTHMHTLTFHRNKLEGTIPGEFVNLSQLEKLITFGNNALTGTISPEMCSLNHLATLVAVCDENDKVVCGCCTKKFCISN